MVKRRSDETDRYMLGIVSNSYFLKNGANGAGKQAVLTVDNE